MKMQQLQVREQVGLAQHLDSIDDFWHGQAKLGAVAGGNPPTPLTFGRQFGAHTEHRLDAQPLADRDHLGHLLNLLEHNDAVLAQAPSQNRLLQVFAVLLRALQISRAPGVAAMAIISSGLEPASSPKS